MQQLHIELLLAYLRGIKAAIDKAKLSLQCQQIAGMYLSEFYKLN